MDLPYTSIVRAHLPRHPCLSNLYSFLVENGPTIGRSRIASLEVSSGSRQATLTGLGAQALSKTTDGFLHSVDDPHSSRTHGQLLLIENIDRQTISELGCKLNIDPMFFASHVHALARDMEAGSPSFCELPSRRKRRGFASFNYHRTFIFPELGPDDYLLLRALNIRRKVAVLPPIQGKRIGIAQHCCSTLVVPRRHRDWLGETPNTRPCSDQPNLLTISQLLSLSTRL